jgi:protein phosphatase
MQDILPGDGERAMKHGLKSCLKKIFLGTGNGCEHPEKETVFMPEKPNGETSVLQPAYTRRLKADPELEQPAPNKNQETQHPEIKEASIVWCGLTDAGRVRSQNEDFFSCADFPEGALFVVADGMGGHDAGEVASRLAAETVFGEIRNNTGVVHPEKLLEHAVLQANAEVLREATSRGSNMGTTLTAAFIVRDTAYIANVGDSRTYWIENGSIRRITEDHSLVEKLVSLGKMTREDARTHPKANVLYRNIGSEGALKVDGFQVPLRKGGNLLLCTDGLWGEVVDEDIHKILTTERDARKACVRLIRTANENGGKDNITAVVVKVE